MPTQHVIAEGESTSSLAAEYGFFPDTVWNDPANAALKQKRRHMNILMPGDVLIIPDKRTKDVQAATEQEHTFVLKGTPALFKMQVYYANGEPRKNQDYQLSVDHDSYAGTTDSEGVLSNYVSPGAKTGKLLLVPQMDIIELDFGALNPITEDSGVRQRLTNLGFACGGTEEELKAALMAFQKDCRLEETGELNDETRRKLEDLHDTVSDYPAEEESPNNHS